MEVLGGRFMRASLFRISFLAWMLISLTFMVPLSDAQSRTICSSEPIPHGYVIVGVGRSAVCSNVGAELPNEYTIANTAGLDQISICDGSPYPAEFAVVSTQKSSSCSYGASDDAFLTHSKTIRKPRPAESRFLACPGSIPVGFESTGEVDFISTCIQDVVGTIPNNKLVILRRILPVPPAPSFPLDNTLLSLYRERQANGKPRKGGLILERLQAGFPIPFVPTADSFDFMGSVAITVTNGYGDGDGATRIFDDKNRDLLFLHPGPPQYLSDTSLGFPATESGIYTFEGAFARANNYYAVGDGVGVLIYKDYPGVPVFSATIPSQNYLDSDYPFCATGVAPFKITVPMERGEIVRFVVTGRGDMGYDHTVLTAKVTYRKSKKGKTKPVSGEVVGTGVGQRSCGY
jgi:hypothetical protein